MSHQQHGSWSLAQQWLSNELTGYIAEPLLTTQVEKKVLEMAQHASFHQHVSYNLSTILHAFTAGEITCNGIGWSLVFRPRSMLRCQRMVSTLR